MNALTPLLIPMNAADDLMNGVAPSWKVFGPAFGQKWVEIAGGFWMVCLALALLAIMRGGAKWALARRHGMSDDMADGAESAKRAAIAFTCLLALNLIVRALAYIAL